MSKRKIDVYKNFRHKIDHDCGDVRQVSKELICDIRCDSGVFFGGLGQCGNHNYIGMPQGSDGNILVVGGNGSGKSSGIAKPTLLTWKGGGLCHRRQRRTV